MTAIGRLTLTYVAERKRMGEFTGGTPTSVRNNLSLFAEFVRTDRDVRRVTRRHVERWLMSGDWAPGTRRLRLVYLRCFFDWCIVNQHVSKNPCAGIKGPRRPRQVPRSINSAQVAAVFSEAGSDARMALVVSLMVQEGLRCCEVAALELGDIDWRRRAVRVHGKGGHERVLWITDETFQALSRYLDISPASAGPLVRSLRDPKKGISKTWVSKIVGDTMRAAQLHESAHSLRHTAASDMLDHGAHIRTLQYVLGHKSLASTEIYLRLMVGGLEEAMGGRQYVRA